MKTNLELQNYYYNKITENYSLHCENGGDYSSFKNLINYDLCFHKADNLVIKGASVNWCYQINILEYWNKKLIDDLLLPVKIDDLILNNFDSINTENNIIEYCFFENYYDFISAKDKFLNDYK